MHNLQPLPRGMGGGGFDPGIVVIWYLEYFEHNDYLNILTRCIWGKGGGVQLPFDCFYSGKRN